MFRCGGYKLHISACAVKSINRHIIFGLISIILKYLVSEIKLLEYTIPNTPDTAVQVDLALLGAVTEVVAGARRVRCKP